MRAIWPGKKACRWRLIGGRLVRKDGGVPLVRDVPYFFGGTSFDRDGWPIIARGNAAVS